MLVGTAIETAAKSKGMFIGGRVVIGSALSFSTTVAPIIAQEYAHPRMRGTVATTYNTVYYVGAIAISWVGFGTSHMTNTSWAWRIPALFQIVPAVYICAALPFLPESPRWLIANGREEEALRILAKYHANGDMNDELVLFEFQEMREVLAREGREAVSWRTALSTPGNRKRFLTITCVSVFSSECLLEMSEANTGLILQIGTDRQSSPTTSRACSISSASPARPSKPESMAVCRLSTGSPRSSVPPSQSLLVAVRSG